MAKFKAFISYKHVASTRFAERLELAIKAYAKPLYRPPMAVFRDDKYLRPGIDLPALIRNALDASEYLIYLASPEAAASAWVRSELEHWCADPARCERLVIVLTAGRIAIDEHSRGLDWTRTDALPASLAERIPSVPLYVDLSWARSDAQQTLLDPDYKKAINAIVAKLRDVDPIELSGEEILQHRRNLRMRNAFVAAIGGLAVLLALAAGFAWDRMLAAEARAREATSRRLAAEADRLAEARLDTALLLMAQAWRMGDNAALRGSWWRLLGAPGLPSRYLPVGGTGLGFGPDGRLDVATAAGPVSFAHEGGQWRRAPSPAPVAGPAPDWEWAGGCERDECDEDPEIWECAEAVSRSIGPYGEADSFCIRSRLRVPGWCGGAAIELPGFAVEASRRGERVEAATERGRASYLCESADGGAGRPVPVVGDPEFFPASPVLALAGDAGPPIRRLARSPDGAWLALLRGDGGVELWSTAAGARARPGVTILAPDAPVQAVASSAGGAIALALSAPEDGGRGGDLLFWADHRAAAAGREADRRFAGAWRPRRGAAVVLALSADAARLAAGTDVAVTIFDTATGAKTGEDAYLGRQLATAAALSTDARWLAVVPRPLDGSLPSGAWLFAGGGGAERARLGRGVRTVAFDPSDPGTLFVAGEGGIERWALASRQMSGRLLDEAVEQLTIAPGRRLLGAALADGSLLVRGIDDPATPLRSGRRAGGAHAVAFLSTADMLLRASEAGLEAWHWPEDSWLTIAAGPQRGLASLPDGAVLVQTGERAAIYDLNPARWLALTCELVGRNLSAAEWRVHFGEGFAYECTCPMHPSGVDPAPRGCAPADAGDRRARAVR